MFYYACHILLKVSRALTHGVSEWKHAAECVKEHENSKHHRKTMLTYIPLASANRRTDTELLRRFESECACWTEELCLLSSFWQRGVLLVAQVTFLAGLITGNFQGILELISEFIPFLKSQAKIWNCKACEEFSQVMGVQILLEYCSLNARCNTF